MPFMAETPLFYIDNYSKSCVGNCAVPFDARNFGQDVLEKKPIPLKHSCPIDGKPVDVIVQFRGSGVVSVNCQRPQKG
jgi:hypothetical protein